MGNSTGFLDIKRLGTQERDPWGRLHDWADITLPKDEETIREQAARCMDCGTPFCHIGEEVNRLTLGCPLYNLIPEWNDLVYRGQWLDAYHRLIKTNNFPEFTSRVCPAPCEGSCNASLPTEAVEIKSIERAIIDKAFSEGWVQVRKPHVRTGKRVAVVGSGPAGLVCADELNRSGHSVTVFEKADRLGGLLMYGIPNMKLEKWVVERRIEHLTKEGITFITNAEIGSTISFKNLENDYDAVVLCIGATKHRDLNISGRHLKGIHFAMDYLKESTQALLDQREPKITATNKNVIVIGGGDTGADCVATALRQNCCSVIQFGKHERLSEVRLATNPWPEPPLIFTLDYAHAEAEARIGKDPRQFEILTKSFAGNQSVTSLRTVEIKKNDHGAIQEVPGTEKEWQADLVLIAIGFEGVEDKVFQTTKVEKSPKGTIHAPRKNFKTNRPGVFAAGDARRGQSLIVWAMREGREVAEEIDRYLGSGTIR
jgi:glutamate synthase (NADPH) small chain